MTGTTASIGGVDGSISRYIFDYGAERNGILNGINGFAAAKKLVYASIPLWINLRSLNSAVLAPETAMVHLVAG
jgi:hypothetical protein